MDKQNIQISKLITAGLIIFILGGFFLLRGFHIITFRNWWAIFFIIPAISSIGNLIEEIARKQPIAFPLISSVAGILFSTLITLFFLYEWNWVNFAYYLILAAGFVLFQTGFIRSDDSIGRFIAMMRFWLLSGGLAVMITGLTLIQVTNLTTIQFYKWFGVAIILFASGGVFQAWKIYAQRKSNKFAILGNLLAAIFIAIPGFFAVINR